MSGIHQTETKFSEGTELQRIRTWLKNGTQCRKAPPRPGTSREQSRDRYLLHDVPASRYFGLLVGVHPPQRRVDLVHRPWSQVSVDGYSPRQIVKFNVGIGTASLQQFIHGRKRSPISSKLRFPRIWIRPLKCDHFSRAKKVAICEFNVRTHWSPPWQVVCANRSDDQTLRTGS